MPAVRFNTSYQGYDPSTIFEVDQATKKLNPYGSGGAYTGRGNTFGQERLVTNLGEFAGYGVGDIINVTPRAQALDAIKGELNNFQNETFAEESAPKRQSSTLAEKIAQEDQNISDALAEFNTLKTRLTSLQSPNYQQEYTKLRDEAGIPQLENDFANTQQNIRELPYVNRQQFGNAGVATEGQLSADTAQKGIPLEIQEANLINRLKLASDFVTNSIKFKELDANSAREAMTTAINLAMDSINISRGRMGDLFDQEEKIEQRADKFRQTFNVTSRFYKFPGSATVYDAETLEPLDYNEYKKRGGVGAPGLEYTDTQEILPQTIQEERAIVADMASKYVDAGITLNDTLASAQAKLAKSRIYADQVRGPQAPRGPQPTVTERLLLNQSNIISTTTNKLDQERATSGDGYANPNSYREAKRNFIASGGTNTDFYESFPIEVYISPGNRKGDLAVLESNSGSGVDPALAAWLGIN